MISSKQFKELNGSSMLLGKPEISQGNDVCLQCNHCGNYGHANSQDLENNAQSISNASDALQSLSFEVGYRKVVSVTRKRFDRPNLRRWTTIITFDDDSSMYVLSSQEISASLETTLKVAPVATYTKAQREVDLVQCFKDWGFVV